MLSLKSVIVSLVLLFGLASATNAQLPTKKFGKGIQYLAQDSSFFMKMNFRFQNQMSHIWDAENGLENHRLDLFVRRARLKFKGWAVSPKLSYKVELGLSNRDLGGGSGPEFNKAANLILDAYITWNFYDNLSIQFGQSKLPGNRERIISSGNLQFVDRSRLNSRYTLDRGFGIQFKYHHLLHGNFLLRENITISMGEGRNVTGGHYGGADYTVRIEALPFGKFKSNGDYISCAIKKEDHPKLAIGITFDNNNNAVRERGQKGRFVRDASGAYHGKTLRTLFVDLMFKYQRWSILAEYADKATEDGSPFVVLENDALIGTFYVGTGLNMQVGYMFNHAWELAGRYTAINPVQGVDSDETQYTFAIGKFIAGHKLKIQTDFTYRDRLEKTNEFFWRTQVEFQF